jgi:hypothetical protein
MKHPANRDLLVRVQSIANEMHIVAHSLCDPTRRAVDVWAHDLLELTTQIEQQGHGEPVACPIKLPVSVDEINAECGHGHYHAYALFDANGRAICDTLNCDYRITRLEEEYDEDSHRMWDEQSRLNMEAIAKALNADPSVSAQEICGRCGNPRSELCGDDFIPLAGTTIESAVKSAVEKYGGLRAAARELEIDVMQLSLFMRYGAKNPSDRTLRKLGLRKIVIFERLGTT